MSSENGFPLLEETIKARRTTKKFDGRFLSKAEIRRLLGVAIFAPNHRLNEPWKFRGILGSGIEKWVSHLDQNLSPDEKKLFEKPIKNLASAGGVVYVTSERNSDEIIDQENYAATSVAIGYLLLGATALKIQSFWSTGKLQTHPATLNFLQVAPSERFVGGILLGWGDIPPPRPRTEADDKTLWIE